MSKRLAMYRGRLLRTVLGGALSATLLLAAPPAHADEVADAEALFNAAKALRDEGDYAQACPKFEASQKLDPQLGTLINIADCYEKLGKWATAWARYQAAIEIAEKRNDDRIAFVTEGKERIEPKVPKVVIRVTSAAEGLTIKRGDVEVSSAMYGVELPVDPGSIAVTVSRGEQLLDTRELQAKEGEVTSLEFDLAAIAKANPPPPDPKPEPVVGPQPPVTPQEPYDPTQRNVGIIVGAVGIAGLLVAGGLELGAVIKKGQANEADACVNKFCSQGGLDAATSAKTFAEVGQWVGIGGLIALAVGATVFFTAPSEPEGDSVALVLPWVDLGASPGGLTAGGLSLGGRF
jgi:Tetratricopeptide repeat